MNNSNEQTEDFSDDEVFFAFDDTESKVNETPNCDHQYKFDTHGFRKTETYKCTKCGHLLHHRWYD